MPIRYAPKYVDVACPNTACNRSLVNIVLAWKGGKEFLSSSCSCANCGQKVLFILINSQKDLGSEDFLSYLLFQYPKPSLIGEFAEGIAKISPSFVEIYSHSREAEDIGLNTLVGIGYRKAIEFLIKDYLVTKMPANKASILNATLSQCIKNYVEDPRIRMSAERAVWLGNDETHYLRAWIDRDLHDLKNLIKLTQYWISSELLTSQYSSEMVKKV